MEDISHSLEFWVGIAHWLTGIGTIVLAFALFRTFKHLEAVTKMTTIETEYRLRPWVGPSSGIKRMDNSINGDIQFSITIKNFGDLPASGVKAKSIVSTNPIIKEALKEPLTEFNLGHLLPHMEKSYWFFIEPSLWEKIINTVESSSDEIPSWVRNNAKWWSEDGISDLEFVNGIQYLVKIGILKV